MTHTEDQGTGTVPPPKHCMTPDNTTHPLKDKGYGGNMGLDMCRVNIDSRKIPPLPRQSLRLFSFSSFTYKELVDVKNE